MPRHKNMHNTRSSASYDSRYDENEHHSNSEDQEEDLDDGDGSESEEFNNLFDAPNDVTKERKGYASSSSSSSSDSSEANCSSSSELSSLTSAKPPRRLGNSDNLPTNPQTSLKKYLPKLFAVPNSKAQKPILLASADKNFSAGIALYKIVAQKDEDIKNYVAGAKACVKGKEDVIKVLKSEIKKLEKKCDSLSQQRANYNNQGTPQNGYRQGNSLEGNSFDQRANYNNQGTPQNGFRQGNSLDQRVNYNNDGHGNGSSQIQGYGANQEYTP